MPSPLPKVTLRASTPSGRHTVALSEATVEIITSEPLQFVDLTEPINAHLRAEGIEVGSVAVFSRHTTAAIRINEAEELLLEDFKHFLRRLCPPEQVYNHNDMSRRKPPIAPDEHPNAHSHLMHLLLSTSETIPVIGSRLALGTWQRVFLVELDGPRRREVVLRCSAYIPQEEEALELKPAQVVNGSYSNGYRSESVTERAADLLHYRYGMFFRTRTHQAARNHGRLRRLLSRVTEKD